MGDELKRKRWLRDFLQNDRGVTAIEYALIGTLIAVVIVMSVGLLGTSVSNMYNKVVTSMPS